MDTKVSSEKKEVTLSYDVTNFLIAPEKSLPIEFVISSNLIKSTSPSCHLP